MEKPFECSRHFPAALGKEMIAPFFHAQIMAENAVNNEENLNSQSSQLEEEDLQKLEADSVPVNTKIPRVVAPWPVAKCM